MGFARNAQNLCVNGDSDSEGRRTVLLVTIAQSGNAAEVTRAAHVLRASAATVGAAAVEGIAGEIERTGDPTLAWRLAEAFARTRAELR